MTDRQRERYQKRMYLNDEDYEVSSKTYNMVIGGTLLYGFIINCLLVYFCGDNAFAIIDGHPVMFYLGYAVLILLGSFMVNGSRNPVVSFTRYNCFVLPLGLILSYIINIYNLNGFSGLVTEAFGITALVTFGMMVVSSIYPDFFLKMGRVLGFALIFTIIIELIMTLLGFNLGIFDYIVIIIFCGYVGYDWARANRCAKTIDNAIDCATDLYVDIVNLFIRILSILSRNSRD